MQGKKKKIGRIIVVIISIMFIVFMWVKKDIMSIYSTMPKEQLLPFVITSVVVTMLKIVGITAVILLIKWIVGKVKHKKK